MIRMSWRKINEYQSFYFPFQTTVFCISALKSKLLIKVSSMSSLQCGHKLNMNKVTRFSSSLIRNGINNEILCWVEANCMFRGKGVGPMVNFLSIKETLF